MNYIINLFSFLFTISFLLGCAHTKMSPESRTEYYARFSAEKVDEYSVHDIEIEVRNDSIFRTVNIVSYDPDFNMIKKQNFVELQIGKTLWRRLVRNDQTNYIPYLNAEKIDTCVSHEFEEDIIMFSFKHCYKGQEDVTGNDNTYKKAYVFLKSTGFMHPIETNAYYTENFILLKEKYVGVDNINFNIERLKEPPPRLVEAYLKQEE